MTASYIKSQGQFEAELDATWAGIQADCSLCSDPDYMGYVWLTGPDRERFMYGSIPFIRTNGPNGPCFIDSYQRTQTGALDPSVRSPECPHRLATGECGIHAARPLVCRMYPLGVEVLVGEGPFWVLHTNCAHVRRLEQAGHLTTIKQRLDSIIGRLDQDLRFGIESTFVKAAELSEPTFDTSCLVRVRRFLETDTARRLQ